MKQSSSLTRKLTQALETHAANIRAKWGHKCPYAEVRDTGIATSIAYRLYLSHEVPTPRKHDISEVREIIADITSRYVDGATIYATIGLWQGSREHSTVVEAIQSGPVNLEPFTRLAIALRRRFNQSAVLVTWAYVSTLEVQ